MNGKIKTLRVRLRLGMKQFRHFVRKVVAVREAPVFMTIVLASAAWCTDHIVERTTKTALVAYNIERATVREIAECTGPGSPYSASKVVNIEYLGEGATLSHLQIDVIAIDNLGKPTKVLARNLCWISGGYANPNFRISDTHDENSPTSTRAMSSRASIVFDQLLPRDRGRIVVPLTIAPANLDLRLRIGATNPTATSDQNKIESARLVETGLLTFLVKHESSILIGFLLILILLAIITLWCAAVPERLE